MGLYIVFCFIYVGLSPFVLQTSPENPSPSLQAVNPEKLKVAELKKLAENQQCALPSLLEEIATCAKVSFLDLLLYSSRYNL